MTTTEARSLPPLVGEAPRVLVTGAGGPAGRGLVPQLLDRGAFVVGVDAREVDVHGVPMHVVPLASDPAYLPRLRQLVDEFRISVVIPTVSEELPILSEAQHTIAADVIIADPAPVRTADDKFLTARWLAARGVDVPATELASTFPDARAAAHVFGSCLVVKPRVSRGGRGVHVVRDGYFPSWSEIADTHVVQEFASADEYCVALYTPRALGVEPLTVTLRKTALAHGLVGNATAVQRVSGADSDVANAARAAIDALGLVGPADVDVRRRHDGTPLVLEVNARFGANHHVVPEILDALLAEASVGAGLSRSRTS